MYARVGRLSGKGILSPPHLTASRADELLLKKGGLRTLGASLHLSRSDNRARENIEHEETTRTWKRACMTTDYIDYLHPLIANRNLPQANHCIFSVPYTFRGAQLFSILITSIKLEQLFLPPRLSLSFIPVSNLFVNRMLSSSQ